MSRTYRKLPIKRPFRKPTHIGTHRLENQAIDALDEFGVDGGNRLKKRANPCSGEIPTAWDDLTVSAWREGRFRRCSNV